MSKFIVNELPHSLAKHLSWMFRDTQDRIIIHHKGLGTACYGSEEQESVLQEMDWCDFAQLLRLRCIKRSRRLGKDILYRITKRGIKALLHSEHTPDMYS